MSPEAAAATATASAQFARSALRYLAERRLPPTPDQYTLAWRAVGGSLPATPKQAAPRAPTAALHGLLSELTDLLVVLCETVPVLVEEEAWARQQFDALRATLQPGTACPDYRVLARARALLERTTEEHQRVLELRRDSLQMLKTMIAQCVGWLSGLVESSGQFGRKLDRHVEEIERATDLPALAGTVRQLIEDTRAVYGALDASMHDFTAAGIEARRLQDEISRLAGELSSTSEQLMSDHLTNLMNRRGLERSFEDLARRCRRQRRPLSLALLDVDDFKKLNDALGHQAGDDALRHLASLLRAKVRPGDLSARYGGEEFVVLMPEADGREGAEVIRRLQRALTVDAFVHRGERIFITFSAGVAQVREGDTLTATLARADDAMYAAKRDGKNGVHIAVPGGIGKSYPAGDRSVNLA